MAKNTSIDNTNLDNFLVKGNLQVGTNTPIVNYPVTIQKSSVGSTVKLEVRNISTAASANSVFKLSSSSGNPYVLYTIGSQSYIHGMDNSDSHAFKIQSGTAFSGSYAMRISSSGLITLGSQSAFSATKSASQSNSTGDGTSVTVGYSNVLFNRNSNYDGVNIYTAPETGIYRFSAAVQFVGLTTQTSALLTINSSSGFIYNLYYVNPSNIKDNVSLLILSGSACIPLNTGETVTVTAQASGGAKTVSLSSTANTGWFFGGLVE